MEPELDPYRVLGVSTGASLLDIARARRRLAMLHHPDLAAGTAAAAEMARINAAWTVLSDPDARRTWDHANEVAAVARGGAPPSWTEWAYAPSPVPRQPAGASGGHAAWWVLAAMIIFLIVIVVGGIVSTLDRPDDLRQTPWLQENLDR